MNYEDEEINQEDEFQDDLLDEEEPFDESMEKHKGYGFEDEEENF